MEIIRESACARAGLIGNPSDGFHGRTISLIVPKFTAQVVLYEWPDLEIVWSQDDQSHFDSVAGLVHDVELHGYYGGIRLVKATIKKFAEYCERQQSPLHDRNFSIRYESNIPRTVGLAGSSAIIVATLRALMTFYNVRMPCEVQPSLALSVETEELGIGAGLQDRVIQVYGGLVFMDFSRDQMHEVQGLQCGTYERLDPVLLPPLYIAFSTESAEPTEVTHGPLHHRYAQRDPDVLAAMQRLAEITLEASEAIKTQDTDQFAALIDENFDIRHNLCDLSSDHERMVETARRAGASAKFAGSCGSIIGTYRDLAMYDRLKNDL